MQLDFEFNANNNKEYEIKNIQNNAIYIKKSAKYLLEFYYLVLWKNYTEKKIPRYLHQQSSTFENSPPPII